MKKQIVLSCVALILGATYVVFYSDLFKKPEIRIKCGNVRFRAETALPGARVFIFDQPLRITSIKVVSVAEAATNKYPHALWHLVAKNSVPVESFVYGENVKGMKPDLAEEQPEPLMPEVKYRLIVETDKKVRGQVDFDPAFAN